MVYNTYTRQTGRYFQYSTFYPSYETFSTNGLQSNVNDVNKRMKELSSDLTARFSRQILAVQDRIEYLEKEVFIFFLAYIGMSNYILLMYLYSFA